jgi:hypothetical protein
VTGSLVACPYELDDYDACAKSMYLLAIHTARFAALMGAWHAEMLPELIAGTVSDNPAVASACLDRWRDRHTMLEAAVAAANDPMQPARVHISESLSKVQCHRLQLVQEESYHMKVVRQWKIEEEDKEEFRLWWSSQRTTKEDLEDRFSLLTNISRSGKNNMVSLWRCARSFKAPMPSR